VDNLFNLVETDHNVKARFAKDVEIRILDLFQRDRACVA
jgi:hypothetical protein